MSVSVPKFTADELQMLLPHEPLRIADWSPHHIKINEGPLLGIDGSSVPWTLESFPPQRQVVEAIDDPAWMKVVLMTAPQKFGKTQCAATPVLMHALAHRRVSAVYVASCMELANSQWKKKFKPAMQADRELNGLLHDNPDLGGNKYHRDFRNGTTLHVVGAESVGNLSGKTAPVIVCDDVHAYPKTLPQFGHPADYAATRAGAFPTDLRTLVHMGTASVVDDWLYRTLEASAFYCPFVPCPKCRTFQLIEFSRFEFDREDVASAVNHTVLRCAGECGYRITFDDLPDMLAHTVWVSMPDEVDWIQEPPVGGVTVDLAESAVFPHTRRNTNVAGFWASAFYWPFAETWGELAAEWITRQGDPDRMLDWQQNIEVRPYKEPEIDEDRLTVDELATHVVEAYAAGTVPAEADLVFVTVDVQSGYVYYLVRAWRKIDGTSWLVDLGTYGKPISGPSELNVKQRRRVEITAALDQLDSRIREGWPRVGQGGEVVGQATAKMCVVDRGFEPDIVASWWVQKHRGVWRMTKGLQAGVKGSLWPTKPTFDDRRRPFRMVNVNQGKHLVRRLCRIGQSEPGYQHLPTDGIHKNTLAAYYRHMSSEVFDRKLRTPAWVKIKEGMRNDWWDCEVYQVCACVACGVYLPPLESDKPRVERRMTPIRGRRRPGGRPFVTLR